jgi:hypothetical protein
MNSMPLVVIRFLSLFNFVLTAISTRRKCGHPLFMCRGMVSHIRHPAPLAFLVNKSVGGVEAYKE